jgi:hypothetical protein
MDFTYVLESCGKEERFDCVAGSPATSTYISDAILPLSLPPLNPFLNMSTANKGQRKLTGIFPMHKGPQMPLPN